MSKITNDVDESFGIPQPALEKIIKIVKSNKKITNIILFGSRAKGNAKKGSDIDIAVVADTLSFDELNKLRVRIGELKIPYTVDLINFNSITNNDLKAHILRAGIEIKIEQLDN